MTARNSLLGCSLAFWGAASCSTMGMFAKFTISEGMFVSQTLLYRLVFMILVLTPVVFCRKERFLGKDRTIGVWITVAALCQASSVTCRFFSFWFISYADAAALDMSALMLFTSIIGRFWLKEKCGLLEAATCGLILLGIALVTIPVEYFIGGSGLVNSTMTSSCVNQSESGTVSAETSACINSSYLNQLEMNSTTTISTDEVETNQQPEDNVEQIFTRLLGCFIAISAGFFNAFAALCCRKIRVHFTIICLHIALWTLPLCLFLTGFLGNFSIPHSWNAFGLLIGCTIFGSMCQLSPFFAYSFETAGAVSTVETAGVPVSYALQAIVQGIYPRLMVGIGSGLITTVILVFGIWKWRQEVALLETMTELNVDETQSLRQTTEL